MGVGAFTRSEIESQPVVWKQTLDKISSQWEALSGQLEGLAQRQFVVIGCGSTFYLANHAAAVLRSVGIEADAFPPRKLLCFRWSTSPMISSC